MNDEPKLWDANKPDQLEPFVIVQRDLGDFSADERREWITAEIDRAYAKGGVVARVTHDTDDPNIYLIEVWKERCLDQGEPRWDRAVKV